MIVLAICSQAWMEEYLGDVIFLGAPTPSATPKPAYGLVEVSGERCPDTESSLTQMRKGQHSVIFIFLYARKT